MGRRPIKEQDRKKPEHYPQMAFRVDSKVKEKLAAAIDRVQKLLNKRREEGEPFINKNDVIVRALLEGLKNLE